MTPDKVQQLREQRFAMLISVEHDISASLYDALESKLRYEHATLHGLAEAAAGAESTRRKSAGLLSTQYFVQKKFDPDLFEL